MNELMMAEQKYPPKMAVQIDAILDGLEYQTQGVEVSTSLEEVGKLRQYIDLLRRRVKNGENRKRSLADLNKSHLVVVMENRWLREAGQAWVGTRAWAGMMEGAKGTLWKMFKKEL